MYRRNVSLTVCAMVVAGAAGSAHATISYTTSGGTISENFDSLLAAGTGNAWANDSTITGWSLFNKTPAAIATYNSGPGSSNAGAFYSFGVAGVNPDAERALGGVASGGAYFGSPASGTVAGWIAVAITNNTASTLTSFTVGYDGEQWRNGGNTSAQTMVLEYGFGASFGAVGSWTAAGAAFDFTSPIVGSVAAALDGNDAANRVAGLGGTVSSLTWNAGDTLWVRWIENNDVGNDHGLAVDNFSFSAVPTPGSAALLGLGALALGRRRR